MILIYALAKDSSSLVRHEAAFALGCVAASIGKGALINALLEDRSYLVRHEAALALADLDDGSVLHALERGLHDPDHEIVISCQVAIGQIHSRSTLPS